MSVDIHSLLGVTNDVSRSLLNAKIVFFDRNCQFVIAPPDVEHSVYCLLSQCLDHEKLSVVGMCASFFVCQLACSCVCLTI